jgi:3-oxoacyl-[acyl-carrier protein] reductase
VSEFPSLQSKRVVITGATGGIGTVISTYLAGEGARLILVSRRPRSLEALASALPGGPHETLVLDVTDAIGWQRLRDHIGEKNRVHGLVTAAGVLGPIGPVASWEVEAFSRTLEVNLVGTLLGVVTLLEALKATRGSIVTYSGGGASGPLPRFDAYAASKAAVVRLTENIAVDLDESGVRANSVAPGFIVTPMHDETLRAGADRVGHAYHQRTRRAVEEGFRDSPVLAARLTAFLLSDASEGITGRLISAQWDPWDDPSFQDQLRRDTDLATLRRVDGRVYAKTNHGRGTS